MTLSDAIRALHGSDENETGECVECGGAMPCDAIRAADEIDAQSAAVDTLALHAETLLARAERAEAAIARVRELCAKRTAESRTPHIAVNVSEVLRALEGDTK